MASSILIAVGCSTQSDSPEAGKDTSSEEQISAPRQEENQESRVTLSEAAYRTAGISVESVQGWSGSSTGEDLEVPGQVEFDPRRVALISPRASGRIERLLVVEGDRVESGQTVALLSSPNHLTAQNDFLQAVRRARALAGTTDEPGASSLVEASRRRLRALGLSGEEIGRLEAGGEPSPFLALTAPFAGHIMEAHALSGAAVEPGEEIFRISDPSVVDVVAEVPERALPLVRIGQRASISIAAYPSMRFSGQVERLRGELNPETRTVRAVIHAANASGRLRPGMFATVRLAVPPLTSSPLADGSGTKATLLTIPETAVISDGNRQFVFTEVGPRTFERREVQVSSLAPPGSVAPVADRLAIRSGLSAGERIVVKGAFILKSELAKAGLGEH